MKLSSCYRIGKKARVGRATAPIPSQKAHGRLRRLSKQRFQRAFMPQCGRLRSMGVCGFEPTDPPPQKIARDNERRASQSGSRRPHASYCSRSRLGRGPGDAPRRDRNSIVSSAHPPIGWAADLKLGAVPSSPWRTKPSCRREKFPGRMSESGSRSNARAAIMVNVPIWSLFQALRQGPFQHADCFSWRERGKLCGVARRNEEEIRRDRPFRGQ
jgi:hypothetical protein